ncbi:MAG: hypothetical protein QXH42_04190 [Thermoplasmata archaeon]
MDQRGGRYSRPEDSAQESGGMEDLRAIMSSVRGDPGYPKPEAQQAPPTRRIRRDEYTPPATGAQPYRAVQPTATQSWGAPAPPDPQELRRIATELQAQKQALDRKAAELREKEAALKKGADLLSQQIGSLKQREEALKAREGELKRVAGELEKKARLLAEREAAAASFEAKEGELARREARVAAAESELRLREQNVLAMEMDIKECPYCNVRYDLEGVRELLDEMRGYGLDVSALEKRYSEALQHLKRAAPEMALDSTQRLIKDLKELRDEVVAKGVRYLVSSTSGTISRAKAAGVDVGEAEALLARAKRALEEKDYRTADYLAKEAEYLARTISKQISSAPSPEQLAPLPATALPQPSPSPPAQGPAWEPTPAQEQPKYEPVAPSEGPLYLPVQQEQPQYDQSQYTAPGPEQPQYEQYQTPAPEQTQYQPYQAPAPEQPEYPAPAPPPARETPAGPRKYSCGSCGAMFQVKVARRPVKAACPKCGSVQILRD